jgi:hypothetical protein
VLSHTPKASDARVATLPSHASGQRIDLELRVPPRSRIWPAAAGILLLCTALGVGLRRYVESGASTAAPASPARDLAHAPDSGVKDASTSSGRWGGPPDLSREPVSPAGTAAVADGGVRPDPTDTSTVPGDPDDEKRTRRKAKRKPKEDVVNEDLRFVR